MKSRASCSSLSKIAIIAFSLLLVSQNCDNSSPVNFEGQQKSLTAYENGTPFLGKPEPGDYIRTFPNSLCQDDNIGLVSVNDDDLRLTKDICESLDFHIPFNSTDLVFSGHNPDYIGLDDAIFERVIPNSNELPISEIWCRAITDTSGLDIIIQVNDSLTRSTAKVYLGRRNSTSEPWRASKVNPFAVSRETSGQLFYSSESISLSVPFPTSGQHQSLGHVIVTVENQRFDQNLNCRVAFDQPVLPLITENLVDMSSLISDNGFAFMAVISAGVPVDNLNLSFQSPLRLFENGIEMGPAHALHVDIRNIGMGRYSHWANTDGSGERIRFASSDNSDPRTNGRIYSFKTTP